MRPTQQPTSLNASRTAVFLVLTLSLCLAGRVATAQTETVLHSFNLSDGSQPVAELAIDAQGNLYGTTTLGGLGYGVVFEVSASGTETVLYAFANRYQGDIPDGGLVLDPAGNVYGTTSDGGTQTGVGTVLKVTPSGAATQLYHFHGPDGEMPRATLLRDVQGNLYGTTFYGGTGQSCGNGNVGCGTVFKVTPTGQETVLYSFSGGTDGSEPTAGLIRDAQGNLYGTTTGNFFGKGNIFELTAAGVETSLYNFTGGPDGAVPTTGLVRDKQGNLYGAASQGGFFGGGCHAVGCGTVFKLTPAGHFRVLHAFTGGADGEVPNGLVRDSAGNLYGTTKGGGSAGNGTVFKVSPDGSETVLYDFSAPGDGIDPYAGLVLDAQGNLYGTTIGGGAFGHGTVFKVVP
jgi:uncharacterized repeat protein (TIGR03803 family)